MEKVLKQVVKILASNTNYATMISGPTYHRNKLKFIQLSKVGENQLLAVLVTEGNMVKNQMIELQESMSDETVLKLNLYFIACLYFRIHIICLVIMLHASIFKIVVNHHDA